MRSKIKKIATGKSGKIYAECLELVGNYTAPHRFIENLYAKYSEQPAVDRTPSITGRIFEYAVCETLAHKNITPFYYQAKFERVPNADFDIVLYNRHRPVVLTLKSSLRERYKQADLEGLALRNVYRNAESYLITLAENEAPGVKRKIASGDVTGLNECILANTPEYTDLLNRLSEHDFSIATEILPITGSTFIGDE